MAEGMTLGAACLVPVPAHNSYGRCCGRSGRPAARRVQPADATTLGDARRWGRQLGRARSN